MSAGRQAFFLAVCSGLLLAAFPAAAGPALDSYKLNQIQMVGTAESAKLAPSPAMLRLIRMGGRKDAQALDFGQPPLAVQLDHGARALSFDIAYDPQGGLLRSPAGASMADELLDKDYVAAMSKPGFKVMHVPDVDFQSSCLSLTDCLRQVAAWSKSHPDHTPLVIALHPLDGKTPMPGATTLLPFDAAAFSALDKTIRATFGGAVLTPDAVKGSHANAWPLLGAARGKVIFVLTAAHPPAHQEGTMFVAGDENSPGTGFVSIEDPVKDAARIKAAVKAGFMVLTRADDETREARANDTSRQDQAFASGAQIILTDFLLPDPAIGPYQVSASLTCDPVNSACASARPVLRVAALHPHGRNILARAIAFGTSKVRGATARN